MYKNSLDYPSWIITDVRYPNEAERIKKEGGILIRINRWIDNIIPIEKVAEVSKNRAVYGVYIDGSETLIEDDSYYNLQKFDFFATELPTNHKPSECSLDNYRGFDFVIENIYQNVTPLICDLKNILQIKNLI